MPLYLWDALWQSWCKANHVHGLSPPRGTLGGVNHIFGEIECETRFASNFLVSSKPLVRSSPRGHHAVGHAEPVSVIGADRIEK